ncbi:hypothetical protein A9Q99_22045 [Gammaproteobacteria bacterium 45_16_T64]|nr:hypothetical protein A9Q99_22045 [Gammaproteobacteria bacterium 45_16_T64]
MSQFDLEIVVSNLEHYTTTNEEAFHGGALSDAKVILLTCEAYANLASALLLLNHDVASFQRQLNLGAQLYLIALQSKEQRQLDPYYMCRTMGKPLFSAIAAKNTSLAQRICQNMPDKFQADFDYEDDFLYFGLIELLIAQQRDEDNIEAALKKFFTASEQGASLRYQVMESICEKNQVQFDEAFVDLIDERELSFQENDLKPDFALTGRHIFVEGVALAHLAKINGMLLQPQYNTLPDICL